VQTTLFNQIKHIDIDLQSEGSSEGNKSKGDGGGNSIAGTRSLTVSEVGGEEVSGVNFNREDEAITDAPSGWEGGVGVASSVDQGSVGGESSVVGASRSAVSSSVEAAFEVEISLRAISVVRILAGLISSSGSSNHGGASRVVEVVDGSDNFNCSSVRVQDVHGVVLIDGGEVGEAIIVQGILVSSTVVQSVGSGVIGDSVASGVGVPLLPGDVGGIAREVGIFVVVEHVNSI